MTLALVLIVIAFVAGVAEGQRVINAVDRAAAEIHVRIAGLEDKLKEKL